MPAWLVNILVFLGVSAPLLATVWGCFNALDRRLKPASRRTLARFLAGLPARLQESLPNIFIDLFDSVFRTRTVNWARFGVSFRLPSLRRSFVVSFLLSTALAVVFAIRIASGDDPTGDRSELGWDSEIIAAKVSAFVFMAFIFNTIVDYLSLLESRLIISRLMPRGPDARQVPIVRLAVFTVMDLLATLFIFYVFWLVIGPVLVEFIFLILIDSRTGMSLSDSITGYLVFRSMDLEGGASLLLTAFKELTDTIYFYFDAGDFLGVYGAFFISTFFTSIWVWLFVAGAVMARIVSLVGRIFRAWTRHFFVVPFLVRHPLKVIGYSLMIFLGVLSVVLRTSNVVMAEDSGHTGALPAPAQTALSRYGPIAVSPCVSGCDVRLMQSDASGRPYSDGPGDGAYPAAAMSVG